MRRAAFRIVSLKNFLLVASVAACAIWSARADSLAAFTPQGFTQGGPSPWDEAAAPGTVALAPGVELSYGLERGKGVAKGGTADAWGGNGWVATDVDSAIAAENYFSVTFAPQTGKSLSFREIQAVIFRGKQSAASYLWQYRLGAGAFSNLGEPRHLDRAALSMVQEPLALDAISALQNVTQPVTFRLVAWGAEVKSSSWGLGRNRETPVLAFEGTVK